MKNTYTKELGKRLAKVRQQQNLSQEYVADRLGKKRSGICRYENGEREIKWLDGLNCSQEKNNRLSYMERFITLKDKKLENITKANLACFRNEFQKNEYLHPTTKNHVLGHVKAVYNYVYEVYDIKNISTVIKPYPNDKQEKEVITLDLKI